MAPGAPGQVFFSYARSDAEFVLKVASALRLDGVELWVDQLDIPTGARWDESVEGALQSCACLVVVLSPASVASFNVLDEVNYTLGEQKRVVPILLHPCQIPFRLKRIQNIDFTAGYERGYRALLAALTRQSEQRPPPPVAPQPFIEPLADPKLQPARGGLYRHMALGAALMFFVLLILALFSNSSTVEPEARPPEQSAPGSDAAPAYPTSESAPAAAGASAAANSAPAPAIADAAPVDIPPPPPAAAGISRADIANFVTAFIVAHNQRDVGQILALYDDGVDYLELGQGAQFASEDHRAMYRFWKDIQFDIVGNTDYEIAADGQLADVAFTLDFEGNTGTEARQGRMRVEMRLRQDGGALKVIRERHPAIP